MRRTRGNNQSEAPGEDSFLDVVANLVGILIILVMVIGAQAHESWQKSAREQGDAQSGLKEALQTAEKVSARANRMTQENRALERRVKEEDLALQLLSAERDAIQVTLLQIEQEIEQLESETTDDTQQRLAAQNRAAELKSEYEKLQQKIELAGSEPGEKIETLEHYPSPIAKTVFGDELHFRLSGGRVAYVPMQELVEMVKLEIEVKGRALEVGQQTTSTVGPVEGFRMQYKLSAAEMTQRSRDVVMRRRVAQVDRFIAIPASEQIGETVDKALSAGSSFEEHIAMGDPETTTISIWTYPDSYSEYRQLKNALTRYGYKIAAWPLPAGQPISGSPDGYQSTAQ